MCPKCSSVCQLPVARAVEDQEAGIQVRQVQLLRLYTVQLQMAIIESPIYCGYFGMDGSALTSGQAPFSSLYEDGVQAIG